MPPPFVGSRFFCPPFFLFPPPSTRQTPFDWQLYDAIFLPPFLSTCSLFRPRVHFFFRRRSSSFRTSHAQQLLFLFIRTTVLSVCKVPRKNLSRVPSFERGRSLEPSPGPFHSRGSCFSPLYRPPYGNPFSSRTSLI